MSQEDIKVSEQNNEKRAAAMAALERLLTENPLIQAPHPQTIHIGPIHMGLGTGSTATIFLELLGAEIKRSNLSVIGVPTSKATQEIAKQLHIPLSTQVPILDLTIDGADWIDPHGQAIKGYGGALLREKIVAQASTQLVLLIDESKMVSSLIGKKLPLELIPFGIDATVRHLSCISPDITFRTTPENSLYFTDNGNHIVDMIIPDIDLTTLQATIKSIPGVVETGLFLDFHPTVIVGKKDGTVAVWNR